MKSETIKVLLIDDDEDDYVLTRELLSEVKAGKYELDWASSYEEGLKVARARGTSRLSGGLSSRRTQRRGVNS